MLPIMKHMLIYVPGLGDAQIQGQRLAVSIWKFYGVETHVCRMLWADKRPFEEKLQRLLELIDDYTTKGFIVSLVGTSAGASAVLHAYSQRQSQVHGVVLICGKVRRPETVRASFYHKNPAFQESMEWLPGSLKSLNGAARKRILSIHPIADSIVPVEDTGLAGVKSSVVPTIGHMPSIAFAVTFGAYQFIRFLKRLPAA